MRPTNNRFFKVIYVPVWFLIVYHYKVICQDLDEDLIPDLYAKYEEAVRSNDTNTDGDTVSLRRLFRSGKEYRVHVKKLKEVNGYKKHNLMIKSILRSNDTIIYINNPVESKIPNAYLTIEEFKKVLRDRVNTKKDAYSILHKPKIAYNFKKYTFLPLKRVSFTKHEKLSHILKHTHWTTNSQKNEDKIKVLETKQHPRTITVFTKTQKHAQNKTSVSTVPDISKSTSKSDDEIITHVLERGTLQKITEPNVEHFLEQNKMTTSLKSTASKMISQAIEQIKKEQDVTEDRTAQSNLNLTSKKIKYSAVMSSSTNHLDITSTTYKEIESENNIKLKTNNTLENIDKGSLNVQKNLILNKTNEHHQYIRDRNINEEKKMVNKSIVNLNVTDTNLYSKNKNVYDTTAYINKKQSISDTTDIISKKVVDTESSTIQKIHPWLGNLTEEKEDATDSAVKINDKVTISDVTEITSEGTVHTEESTIQETYPWVSYLDEEKKDITDSVVNTYDIGAISYTTDTKSEGIVVTEESTIQGTNPWYRPRRGKTRLRTTKTTTKRMKRTYGDFRGKLSFDNMAFEEIE